MWALWDSNSLHQAPPESPLAKYNCIDSVDEDEGRTVGGALECDYERDCTPLYKKIEEEKFGAVMDYLRSGYWPGSFFADPVAPLDQTRTWVTRFEYKESKRVRWSQLPLHVAIVVEAPMVLIKRLVELYPQAARCTDDQRMLPLHLALRHGCNEEVVAFLLKQFPEAVNVRGGKGEGRLPVEYAIRGPNKALGDILETFVTKSNAKATKAAAKHHAKDLEFLQAKLQAKEYELSNVKSKLLALDDELEAKRAELKTSLQNMKKLSALKLNEIEETGILQDDEQAQEQAQKSADEQGGGDEEMFADLKQTKSEHDTLKKQIEELEEQKKLKEEEQGLLQELGSVIDESIYEIKKRSKDNTKTLIAEDPSYDPPGSTLDEEGMEAEAREDNVTVIISVADLQLAAKDSNDEKDDGVEKNDTKKERVKEATKEKNSQPEKEKKDPQVEGTKKQPQQEKEEENRREEKPQVKPEAQEETREDAPKDNKPRGIPIFMKGSRSGNRPPRPSAYGNSTSEVDSLRSEVDRLRLELEKKTTESKKIETQKPNRGRPVFFRKKRNTSLVSAPTV